MNDAVSPNNRSSWRYDDPAPEIPLAEIEPISVRAEALIVRSPSALLQSHFVQIIGAATILSGLDYHHQNFIAAVQRLPQFLSGEYFPPVRHEAIAWINRVGQLYYFCKSKLVAEHVLKLEIPTIESVLPFRNKHSAHRSIDAPRSEDSPHLQFAQALVFSELGGQFWTPRSDAKQAASELPLSATTTWDSSFNSQTGNIETLWLNANTKTSCLKGTQCWSRCWAEPAMMSNYCKREDRITDIGSTCPT